MSFDVIGCEMGGFADRAQVQRLGEVDYIFDTYGLARTKQWAASV